MKQKKRIYRRLSELLFVLLLLQNPLENLLPPLRFLDEAVAVMGFVLLVFRAAKCGIIRLRGTTILMTLLLLGFLLTGLLGNCLWQYQSADTALVDLVTNVKFFLALITGAALLGREGESARRGAVLLFCLLVADLAFQIFPSMEQRYGLRVVQLLYSHPTYLAGAAVFLLAILTAEYEKRNRVYILMCLVVLLSTLRGKAIAGTVIYFISVYFLLYRRKTLKLRHLLGMGLGALAVGGRQFAYYYLDLQGRSARSVLTQTAFQILRDYFPIGTGFGTYASHVAANPYSPVYVKYGFRRVYELGGGGIGFFDDTFWPIILGQTGLIGSVCYLILLGLLFLKILQVRRSSIPAYTAGVFVFLYLLVSATSEPAFNNSVSIPLAMVLGSILARKEVPCKSLTVPSF